MWKRTILAAAITLGLGVPAAFAQTTAAPARHPAGINAREERQMDRIKDARKDGQLSNGELDRLLADEAAFRAKERFYRESGERLDSAEYKDLQKNLNRLSREIYRLSHDGKK